MAAHTLSAAVCYMNLPPAMAQVNAEARRVVLGLLQHPESATNHGFMRVYRWLRFLT